MAVDTLGHLLSLLVTAANEQERAYVGELAAAVQDVTGGSVERAYVDQGYSGPDAPAAAAAQGIELEVVERPAGTRGFVLQPRRWAVERSFAWLARCRRLARDYERLPETLVGLHFAAFAIFLLKRVVQLAPQIADTDGFEVCRQLRADWVMHHLPIVLLTSSPDAELLIRGLLAGADDCLSKPFILNELIVWLHRLIAMHEQDRAHYPWTGLPAYPLVHEFMVTRCLPPGARPWASFRITLNYLFTFTQLHGYDAGKMVRRMLVGHAANRSPFSQAQTSLITYSAKGYSIAA